VQSLHSWRPNQKLTGDDQWKSRKTAGQPA
jgi:hypothetical protein